MSCILMFYTLNLLWWGGSRYRHIKTFCIVRLAECTSPAKWISPHFELEIKKENKAILKVGGEGCPPPLFFPNAFNCKLPQTSNIAWPLHLNMLMCCTVPNHTTLSLLVFFLHMNIKQNLHIGAATAWPTESYLLFSLFTAHR